MRKENLKLMAIIIVGLLIYGTFFIETVEDVPIEQKVEDTSLKNEIVKDTLNRKDTIQ